MDNNFRFTTSVIALPLCFVLLLWVIYWIDVRFQIDLSQHGILPRTFSGLQGIIFSPFLSTDLY